MLNKKSVSLVEVMVALVILVTCVAGMYATFIAGRKAVARSKRKLIAINYARKVAESLKYYVRQTDYDSQTAPLGCSSYPCPKDPRLLPLLLNLPSGLPNASTTYTVDNIPVGTVNMRKVVITVTWEEPGGQAEEGGEKKKKKEPPGIS